MKNYCMIVDDNELVRETTALLVEHIAKCPTRCFSSGEEALRAFEAEPGAFGCVITDFQMPGIDGLELGRLVHAAAPDVQLLLVTGRPDMLEGVDVTAHGFDGMLAKPFNVAEMRAALRPFPIANGRSSCSRSQKSSDNETPAFAEHGELCAMAV